MSTLSKPESNQLYFVLFQGAQAAKPLMPSQQLACVQRRGGSLDRHRPEETGGGRELKEGANRMMQFIKARG